MGVLAGTTRSYTTHGCVKSFWFPSAGSRLGGRQQDPMSASVLFSPLLHIKGRTEVCSVPAPGEEQGPQDSMTSPPSAKDTRPALSPYHIMWLSMWPGSAP